MSDVPQQFDDPALKAAIRRAWATPLAPADLRLRVAAKLASDRAAEVPARVPLNPETTGSLSLWPLIGLAAAAMVALVLGIGFHLLAGSDGEELPGPVAMAMVIRHDGCCAAPDHHLLAGVPPDNFSLIGRRLSADLKVPILSTNVQGWTFCGAGPCPVGGHESAHLLYRHGQQTLSVFTLPVADFGITPGNESYVGTVENHHIAGFVRGNGLYCVVEFSPDGSISQQQVESLRDRLRSQFQPTEQLAVVESVVAFNSR